MLQHLPAVTVHLFGTSFSFQNEEVYFRKFVAGLVSIWESQLNLDWSNDESLPDSKSITPDTGPHLSRLPEELLPAIGKFLYVTKDNTEKVGVYFEYSVQIRFASTLMIYFSCLLEKFKPRRVGGSGLADTNAHHNKS